MKLTNALLFGAVTGTVADIAAASNIKRSHAALSAHPWLPGSSLTAHAMWAWVAFTVAATLIALLAGQLRLRASRAREERA